MVASPYVTAMLSLFCAVTTAADTAGTVEAALAAALVAAPDPDICEVGGSGYVFPLFGDDEAGWPKPVRGIQGVFGENKPPTAFRPPWKRASKACCGSLSSKGLRLLLGCAMRILPSVLVWPEDIARIARSFHKSALLS